MHPWMRVGGLCSWASVARHRLRRILIIVTAVLESADCQQLVKVMSGSQMRQLHAAMDSNGDGFVSHEEGSKLVRRLRAAEMWQQTGQIMQTMDTNKDGFLSVDELTEDLRHFKIADEQKADFIGRFSSFDVDGDGLLSPLEAQTLFNFMFPFQKLDVNHDGMLSLSEFRAIAAPKLEGAPPTEVTKSKHESKGIFASLDANKDGQLDAHEHYVFASGIYAGVEALRKLFELADTDKDGLLSADELAESRAHPQFGGTAAYHHSRDWIERITKAAAATANIKSEL